MTKVQKKVMSLVLAIVMLLPMGAIAMAADATSADARQVVQGETKTEILKEIEVTVDENGIVPYALTEIGSPVSGNLSGGAGTQFAITFDKKYKKVYAIFVAKATDGSSVSATYLLTFNGTTNTVVANGQASRAYVGDSVSSGRKIGSLNYTGGDKKPCIFVIQFVGEA